jgi:putative cell wall-binding protein
MRRAVSSGVLTVVALPALLALPVAGPLPEDPHPVAPTIVSLPLSGVDPVALGEEPAGTAGAPGGGAAAKEAVRPAVLTGRRAARSFDLIALTWQRGAAEPGTRVRVRVREMGVWSDWKLLEVDDEGPDDGSAEAARAASEGRDGTEPLLVASDGFQARVDTPSGKAVPGLAVDLVSGGRSDADGGAGSDRATAAAATPSPNVVTRAKWGADERLVKETPVTNRTVKTLVVHHTATTNSYTSAGAYAQIRAVYAFHTKQRGWNDIGYNFLVDRFGRVYEGRRGSLTSPIRGAHTGGFNAASLGVSVLGTYTSTSPSSAAVKALATLLSWQAAQNEIHPGRTASIVSSGHTGSRYKAGATARVLGIVGHRDLGYTECPGSALYRSLAGFRTTAASRMKPGLTGPAMSALTAPEGTGSLTFTATIPTRQRWSLAVTALCGGTAVRTMSGVSSGRITATWNLKDSAGRPVPPGAYTVTVTSHSPVGAVPAWLADVEVLPTVDTTVPTPSPSASPTATQTPAPPVSTVCSVRRAAGLGPALTSVIAGRAAAPDARSVVLVNATGSASAYAEALAVAPFAAAQTAPVLLTGTVSLPDPVARDIASRKVTSAWIVGSTSSVGAAVEERLRSLGVATVRRIGAGDHWETAAELAVRSGAPHREAVLVSGDPGQQLDALTAAASAASTGRPLLLTSRAGVPAATLDALRTLRVTSVTVVGSTVTIPDSTLTALTGVGVTSLTRVIGASRFATAAAVVAAAGPGLPLDRVVLTSGLVISPELLLASAQNRPLLLTSATSLSAPTSAWLTAHPKAGVTVVAPPSLVSTAVLRAAQSSRR